MHSKTFQVGAASAALIFVSGLLFFQSKAQASVPTLTQTYTNDAYGFSLMMPANFAAGFLAAEDNGVDTVILQNDKGQGIQVMMYAWDEDASALTPERIEQETGLLVFNPQIISINGIYGLAFRSDNDDFDGVSSDVWFVHGGIVYQLTANADLEPLLHAIAETWRFF